jgi:hypothetical protein
MVDRAMREVNAPRRVADLNSQQRSELMESVVRQLAAVTVAHNRLGAVVEAQGKQITALTVESDAQAKRIDEHGQRTYLFMIRPFMARLRWLVTGR